MFKFTAGPARVHQRCTFSCETGRVSDVPFDSPVFNRSLFRPLLLLVPVAIVGSAVGSLVVTLGMLALNGGDSAIGDTLGFLCFFASTAFVVGFVGALAGTLLFGLPAMLVLRRAGKESAWTYALAGVIGTVLLSLFAGPAHLLALLLLPYGLATALAFWRIVRAPALREARGA
jgi:hypothetical protein